MFRAIDWTVVPMQFVIWLVICSISAAPSFFVGAQLHPYPLQRAAMIVGVAIFIIAYTLITSTHFMRRARRNKALRRTIQIGYGTRIALSVFVPVGLFVDMCVGIVSTQIVHECTRLYSGYVSYENGSRNAGFITVLITTLIQGVLLNIVLMIYMSIIYFFARLIVSPRPPAGICVACGYDLRASTTACPECGTPIARPIAQSS